MRICLATLCLLLPACSSDDGGNVFETGTSTSITASASGSSTGAGETATDGSGTTGIKLDVGDSGGTGSDAGCKKIDFLFVIDNSGSMDSEQAFLVAAFPQFIQAIEDNLPDATDFHIGVVKTDELGQDGLGTAPAFPDEPCVNTWGGLIDRDTPELDWTGYGASCGFTSGQRWVQNDGDVATQFACAAEVGVRGDSWEQQAHAATAALTDQTCNAGFLRDDALLVLVMVTDEDDDYSEGDPAGWFDAVVAAKADIETNVVTVLLSGGFPRWGNCEPLNLDTRTGAAESEKLTDFAERFSNHHLGSVCAEGYGDVLGEALSTIESACDDFTPVG